MVRRWIRTLRAIRESNRLPDIPAWQVAIVQRVRPFTMTGVERILATIGAIEYIERHAVPGAIVECGVWKGGQMMAAALTLRHLQANRQILLFDTFEGMTEPEEIDRDLEGNAARPVFDKASLQKVGARWCEARVDEVRRNVESTGYPVELVQYVVGPVEETLPDASPESIAYLRLDTDWYASTVHELNHLFPLVSRLGVVTIDDYGHWEGARKATDEYLSAHGIPVLLHRIDYSGRQFVKP